MRYDGSARRVDWPDCANARDLGGLPTVDRGRIRAGALFRSDSLQRLTPAGVAALRRAGVRRIVDLRSAEEAATAPTPFATDPICHLIPLVDPAREAERDRSVERTMAQIYRRSVSRNARTIALGLAAIADAPAGAVVVHCYAGKDRTGMAVALALRVAGVVPEVIAEDYAYTEECLCEVHEARLAALTDDDALAELREAQSSHPETILAMLDEVDRRYGDVRRYLLASGLTVDELDRLRERLLG